MNNEPAGQKRQRPLSIWDLPASLLTQPHNFRRKAPKRGRERSHQAAILAFIYRNRFATAPQVQRRFPDFLRSDRTTRRHLAEMQESLGYLDLVPTPSPLWPKVYSVSSQGMRQLAQAFRKKQPSWRPPLNDRRRVGFSIHHVYHELACTEFLLQIHKSAKANGVELLEIQRRSLVNLDSFCLPKSAGSRLVPDGMVLLRTRQGMICTFVEIDTGSMSLNAIVEKFGRYSAWSATDRGQKFVSDQYRKHGAQNPQPRFRVAVICGDRHQTDGNRRLELLAGTTDQLPPSIRRSCWLTTATAVRDADNVFSSAIWRRIEKNGTFPHAKHAFFQI